MADLIYRHGLIVRWEYSWRFWFAPFARAGHDGARSRHRWTHIRVGKLYVAFYCGAWGKPIEPADPLAPERKP